MDDRPIGIFDSGVGGLTAVRAMTRLLPGERIVYFGDSGRMPYGGRPKGEIVRMALQIGAFLLKHDVKVLLAACNTTDSNALGELSDAVPVPVFGVVRPAAAEAVAHAHSGRIGVISTVATAQSGAFERAVAQESPAEQVLTVGCPTLAELVEQGHTDGSDPLLAQALRECLTPMREIGVDTLILGCTHYPLVSEAISAFMGPGVTLVDSGAAGARALARELAARHALAGEGSRGGGVYYTSGDERAFARSAAHFLGTETAVTRVAPFSS